MRMTSARLARTLLLPLIGMAVVAAAPANAQSGKGLPVTIGMPSPVVQAIGAYYSSIPATLYWKDEGLEVKIENMNGANAAAEALSAGLLDVTLGASQALFNLEKARPSSAIGFYTLINRFQDVTAVLADSKLNTVLDLQGKTIGVQSLANTQGPILKALVKQAGGDASAVQLVAVGDVAEAAFALQKGRVDAIAMADGQIAQIDAKGIKLKKVTTSSLDLTKVGFGGVVFTRRDYLAKNRETLVRLARGIAKGAIFAKENPEAAVRIHWKFYPATKTRGVEEAEAMRMSLAALNARMENVEPSQGLWGAATDDQIKSFIDLLVTSGSLTEPMALDRFWTADLIKEINDFDADAIRKQARGYKE
jgi:NitT/TauT family transport system substrate-binding protein